MPKYIWDYSKYALEQECQDMGYCVHNYTRDDYSYGCTVISYSFKVKKSYYVKAAIFSFGMALPSAAVYDYTVRNERNTHYFYTKTGEELGSSKEEAINRSASLGEEKMKEKKYSEASSYFNVAYHLCSDSREKTFRDKRDSAEEEVLRREKEEKERREQEEREVEERKEREARKRKKEERKERKREKRNIRKMKLRERGYAKLEVEECESGESGCEESELEECECGKCESMQRKLSKRKERKRKKRERGKGKWKQEESERKESESMRLQLSKRNKFRDGKYDEVRRNVMFDDLLKEGLKNMRHEAVTIDAEKRKEEEREEREKQARETDKRERKGRKRQEKERQARERGESERQDKEEQVREKEERERQKRMRLAREVKAAYQSAQEIWSEAFILENNNSASDAKQKFEESNNLFKKATTLMPHVTLYKNWFQISSLKLEGDSLFNEAVTLQEQGNLLRQKQKYVEALEKYGEALKKYKTGYEISKDSRFEACIEFVESCIREVDEIIQEGDMVERLQGIAVGSTEINLNNAEDRNETLILHQVIDS